MLSNEKEFHHRRRESLTSFRFYQPPRRYFVNILKSPLCLAHYMVWYLLTIIILNWTLNSKGNARNLEFLAWNRPNTCSHHSRNISKFLSATLNQLRQFQHSQVSHAKNQTANSQRVSQADRNLQRECANMRSNNLNKYAIFHFIMHICHSLSAQCSAISCHCTFEDVLSLYLLLHLPTLCMWHIWILYVCTRA